MAVTPKIVRRHGGGCLCLKLKRADYMNYTDTLCRYGLCAQGRCKTCRGVMFSIGPMGCECDGGPRWARHRGMAHLGKWDFVKDEFVDISVAIKPSIAKRRRRG